MTTEPTPDEIRRATFRVVFRGYDQAEVESRLQDLSAVVEQLTEQRDRLASRLGEFAERDLKSEFEVVGREVTSVLEAARAAAETMRDRAGADAARWRSEAMAEVEAMRKSARADAEAMRTDAWTTSSQLLEQVVAEVERTRAASERDSLAVMGEAEREAHRLTSTARREAEEVVRAAKMEAERLVAQAQADHDDIIATAHRQAEAAQERTRALEQRRQELMGELEALRATLASFESELEDRRQGIGLSEPMELPHRAVVSDEDGVHEVADWEEGHTVRVIRPGRDEPPQKAPAEPDPESTDAEDVAEEVARLRSEEAIAGVRIIRPEPAGATSAAAEEPEPETAAEASEPEEAPEEPEKTRETEQAQPEAPPEIEQESEPAAPRPDEKPVEEEIPASQPDEVLELFRRLRAPGETETSHRLAPRDEPELEATEPEVTAPEEMESEASPEPETSPESSNVPDDVADPFETRDRLLLPIANQALRAVKRVLTEAQNEALEQIRLGRWEVEGEELEARVHDELVALSEEAALAGAEAATELGVTGGGARSPQALPPPELGQDLAGALRAALDNAGPGSRERQAAVSRVFRGWRTDEAERRLRHLALSAYHHSLREVLDDHGREWEWQAAGRLCATCRAASEAGHQLPPVHRDCQCTIVPV